MTDDDQRDAAIKRIKEKRDFRNHAATYVIVNLFMVAIWAFSGGGAFWPIWVIVPWGVGLAFHGWNVYNDRPITEADIDKELGEGA